MDHDNTYLMHHGTKGMKWGVRRFRNYDGTLTPAGKAQRRAENGSSSRGTSNSSGKAKKRLATAAKVAGAAAAIGGAAYLANRAAGKSIDNGGTGFQNAGRKIGAAQSKMSKKAQGLADKAADAKATANAAKRYASDNAKKAVSGAKKSVGEAAKTVKNASKAGYYKTVGKGQVERQIDRANRKTAARKSVKALEDAMNTDRSATNASRKVGLGSTTKSGSSKTYDPTVTDREIKRFNELEKKANKLIGTSKSQGSTSSKSSKSKKKSSFDDLPDNFTQEEFEKWMNS